MQVGASQGEGPPVAPRAYELWAAPESCRAEQTRGPLSLLYPPSPCYSSLKHFSLFPYVLFIHYLLFAVRGVMAL